MSFAASVYPSPDACWPVPWIILVTQPATRPDGSINRSPWIERRQRGHTAECKCKYRTRRAARKLRSYAGTVRITQNGSWPRQETFPISTKRSRVVLWCLSSSDNLVTLIFRAPSWRSDGAGLAKTRYWKNMKLVQNYRVLASRTWSRTIILLITSCAASF
jgi:hypothetical protein